MSYLISMLKKWYVPRIRNMTFSGRVNRKEYFMFLLFNLLITLLIPLLFTLLLYPFNMLLLLIAIPETYLKALAAILLIWLVIFIFFTTLAALTATVQRLHDIGNSGAWVIILLLIPFCFVVTLFPGESRTNKYGARC